MWSRVILIALIAARLAFEQALPPAKIEQPEDARALLTQASEKIVNSVRRLPKYTCLETIDRAYYLPPREKHRLHMMTEYPAATACMGNQAAHLLLQATDRLRVEVAALGGREVQSWPGATRFDTWRIDELIPFGPLSTGSFGTTLSEVFANPGAQITFVTTKENGSREVFEYSFHVPSSASHSYVKGSSAWRVTAFSGSFEIDKQTAELVRLVLETDLLPPDTGMCRAKISNEYHLVPIGGAEFLLPRRNQFETFDTNGGGTDSVTEFSACREYKAESSVRFDDQDVTSGSSKAAAERAISIPPGISLTLALLTAIDPATAAAGDPVSARVVHPVLARGSKEVLAPAGAIASGRILKMWHELHPAEWQVDIRFDALSINGSVSPLSVRLARELKAERRTSEGFVTRGTEFWLPAHGSPDSGSHFVFPAKSRVQVVPAGFQSKWTTVAP